MEDEIIEKLKLKIAISEIKRESEIAMKRKRSFISKKIGIAACACIVLISGFVYAKDIENYFRGLFTNSTEAIDKAVENGYVQKEEMDYVYDKDIGVKVDNLVIDDLNLAISFNFETKKENIKSIRFNDFTISNDNDKVVFRTEWKYSESLEELPLYSGFDWSKSPQKTSEITFADSIILGLRPDIEEFKELFFDIKSIDLTYENDERETIEGNWKFNVKINEEMRKSTIITYSMAGSNEYVKSCEGTLSPTGLIVKLEFSFQFDAMEFFKERNLRGTEDFYMKNGNEYIFSSWTLDANNRNCIIIEYEEFGSFSDNLDTIVIYSELYNTSIVLKKNKS